MKKVYYDPTDKKTSAPDAKAMEYAEKLLKEDVLYVSNALVILSIRVLIKRQSLAHNEVEFHFNGQIITVNEVGGQYNHPVGYCDEIDALFAELFGI